MTKKELLEAMAAEADISQADADKALGALIEAITKSVAKGDSVRIPDLGTFEKRERSARTGRNPQTGEEIKIAATSVPGFKPATQFKNAVAGAKKK
ncbi:HU family DNA-binding protein [Mariniluteicoccus endophyticus]